MALYGSCSLKKKKLTGILLAYNFVLCFYSTARRRTAPKFQRHLKEIRAWSRNIEADDIATHDGLQCGHSKLTHVDGSRASIKAVSHGGAGDIVFLCAILEPIPTVGVPKRWWSGLSWLPEDLPGRLWEGAGATGIARVEAPRSKLSLSSGEINSAIEVIEHRRTITLRSIHSTESRVLAEPILNRDVVIASLAQNLYDHAKL